MQQSGVEVFDTCKYSALFSPSDEVLEIFRILEKAWTSPTTACSGDQPRQFRLLRLVEQLTGDLSVGGRGRDTSQEGSSLDFFLGGGQKVDY